jgi:predicted amidohydrolase YtcJ
MFHRHPARHYGAVLGAAMIVCRYLFAATALVVPAIVATAVSAQNAAPADMLFTGGAIFTATGAAAEAVAVRDGEIIYVGSAADAQALRGPGTELVEIGEGLLLPGMIDAHVHPVGVGMGLTVQCNLSGIGERKRILEKIASCAAERDGASWLIGRGWALGAFEESKPAAADLDRVLPRGDGGLYDRRGRAQCLGEQ